MAKSGRVSASLLMNLRWLRPARSAIMRRAERKAVSPDDIGAAITPIMAIIPPTVPNYPSDMSLTIVEALPPSAI